jgi:hypothetical protein
MIKIMGGVVVRQIEAAKKIFESSAYGRFPPAKHRIYANFPAHHILKIAYPPQHEKFRSG